MPRSARKTAVGCVRCSRRSNARGGQAPALRLMSSFCFIVGLGPSHATRACERVSLAMPGSIIAFAHSNARGGQAPALRYSGAFFREGPRATVKNATLYVGRGPVPRRASIGAENGLGLRSVFARVGRSRGTGPRATVAGQLLFHRRARDRPAIVRFSCTPTIARDRPSRYGIECVLREGQALARWESTRAFQICPTRGKFAARLNAEYLR